MRITLRELHFNIYGILVEGKVDDLKAKFPDDVEIIDRLSKRDPSGKQKYLEWMLKQIKSGTKEEDLLPTIQFFHQNNQRFDKKDINAYSAKTLEDKVKELSSKKTHSKVKSGGTEKVFENDRYILFYIKDKDACMTYGANTKWCITMNKTSHWENYVLGGAIFYFLIDKKREPSDPLAKVAFATVVAEDDGQYDMTFEIFDANDAPLKPKENFQWVQDIIKKHAPSAERPKFPFSSRL